MNECCCAPGVYLRGEMQLHYRYQGKKSLNSDCVLLLLLRLYSIYHCHIIHQLLAISRYLYGSENIKGDTFVSFLVIVVTSLPILHAKNE
jgi:hypothetical protein